jgi:DNA-binding MarR family transcriptional regulator/predicted N-acetyltransferase YhbS
MTTTTDQKVDMMRSFNRFYTKQIGVLSERLLGTPYSLTEARILFELAQGQNLSAINLIRKLGLDAGYMSRILTSLENAELLTRVPSEADKRRRLLKLTDRGQKAFNTLNGLARAETETLLANLTHQNQHRLLRAMSTIEHILSPDSAKSPSIVIRTHRPGDIGWIVERHGELYFNEYRFDETFEALVAEILAGLIKGFDPRKECIWIAEVNGERAGTILTARRSESIALLRLFLVEPWARGNGIGRRLVDESVRFSRAAGYKRISLWTQSILVAARHIYENAGFILTKEEPHHSFSRDLTGETWEKDLVN